MVRPHDGLLCSCILLSWYAVYFMANMHCVLLIELIYVFSYGLQCIAYMMNNMYTLQHVKMCRGLWPCQSTTCDRVMLRHRHVLHKILARRTLDGNYTPEILQTYVFTTIVLDTEHDTSQLDVQLWGPQHLHWVRLPTPGFSRPSCSPNHLFIINSDINE
jgi:hypothetical protein